MALLKACNSRWPGCYLGLWAKPWPHWKLDVRNLMLSIQDRSMFVGVSASVVTVASWLKAPACWDR
eukprot:538801-Karenia_brevis.AAC.1